MSSDDITWQGHDSKQFSTVPGSSNLLVTSVYIHFTKKKTYTPQFMMFQCCFFAQNPCDEAQSEYYPQRFETGECSDFRQTSRGDFRELSRVVESCLVVDAVVNVLKVDECFDVPAKMGDRIFCFWSENTSPYHPYMVYFPTWTGAPWRFLQTALFLRIDLEKSVALDLRGSSLCTTWRLATLDCFWDIPFLRLD